VAAHPQPTHPGPAFPACLLCSVGGGGGGQVAKDALGNDVKATTWLASHPIGDRSLAQGLKVRWAAGAATWAGRGMTGSWRGRQQLAGSRLAARQRCCSCAGLPKPLQGRRSRRMSAGRQAAGQSSMAAIAAAPDGPVSPGQRMAGLAGHHVRHGGLQRQPVSQSMGTGSSLEMRQHLRRLSFERGAAALSAPGQPHQSSSQHRLWPWRSPAPPAPNNHLHHATHRAKPHLPAPPPLLSFPAFLPAPRRATPPT
jgi:hypothetical protein